MSAQQSSLFLAHYFQLKGRYARSVNLERDLEKADTLQGYILTPRCLEALKRMASAFQNPHAHRAWIITGVYGTGKSAFAQFVAALWSDRASTLRRAALGILTPALGSGGEETATVQDFLPPQRIIGAVATGRAEPLRCTVLRALERGINRLWPADSQNDLIPDIRARLIELDSGTRTLTDSEVINLVKLIFKTVKAPIVLILDELGKNLEYAAQNQGVTDLYLLQQLAELEGKGHRQLYILGLLHQSFAGYSDRLAATEQHEWNKIQGRLENLSLTESPSQMTRLLGQAIHCTDAEVMLPQVQPWATAWAEALASLAELGQDAALFQAIYPLHPLTALVLPLLCTRYAQHDRSLFSFLTSGEPLALPHFLATQTPWQDSLPTLQLHHLYDYFMESMAGLASRINLQRWVEIQSLIEDARGQDTPGLQLLKTIGLLNLVTTTGPLRASRHLVALALVNHPNAPALAAWEQQITTLVDGGRVAYRSAGDELRIWEGSDFNIEAALYEHLEQQRFTLAELLGNTHPLRPIVAQRHYAHTGTLRYFGQIYGDSTVHWGKLRCQHPSQDGLVVYWLDRGAMEDPPATTVEGKPLVVVPVQQLDLLKIRAQQLQALITIQRTAPQLKQDGVARRELRQRLGEARSLLDTTVSQAFHWRKQDHYGWIGGQKTPISSPQDFQRHLSDLCDRTYPQGIYLDHELINRRQLTTQGTKARRSLLAAMLLQADQPGLGLGGYGPEVAIYKTVLAATGIHRPEAENWGFYPPQSGLQSLWQAIEAFCFAAQDQPRCLGDLYDQLHQPPYGIKAGVVPLVLAAVLLHHRDQIGLYQEGQFIPVLGLEHFERLVKDPSIFAVKSFDLQGFRTLIFQELEKILRSPQIQPPPHLRNATLLMVTKPLFAFVRNLPPYTLQTQHLSDSARSVLTALQQAQQPDLLLFSALPQACGFVPLTPESAPTLATFPPRLAQALQEIQGAYGELLKDCQRALEQAFGIPPGELRSHLGDRCGRLVDRCLDPSLKRLLRAGQETGSGDRPWLEAVVMVIADKPATSWKDSDIIKFELNLGDLCRRFRNLEALAAVDAPPGSAQEARRFTVTQGDGREVHRVVWVDRAQMAAVDQLVADVLGRSLVQGSPELREALLVRLTEQVLGDTSPPPQTETPELSNPQPNPQPQEFQGRTRRRSSSQRNPRPFNKGGQSLRPYKTAWPTTGVRDLATVRSI